MFPALKKLQHLILNRLFAKLLIYFFITRLILIFIFTKLFYGDYYFLIYHCFSFLLLDFIVFSLLSLLINWQKKTSLLTSFLFGLWLVINFLFYINVFFSNNLLLETLSFERLIVYVPNLLGSNSVYNVKLIVIAMVIVILLLFFIAFKISRSKKALVATNNKTYYFIALLATASLVHAVLLRNHARRIGEPLTIFIKGEVNDINDLNTPEKIALAEKEKIAAKNYTATLKENSKDIVIILIDALRADHLPMYGYERETMPFYDSLYKSGALIKIDQTLSTCACTDCGVPSLFQSKSLLDISLNAFSIFHLTKKIGYQNFFIAPCFDKSWQSVDNLLRNQVDYFYDSDSSRIDLNDDYNILNALETVPQKNKPGFFYFHLYSAHYAGVKHKEFEKYTPNVWGINDSREEKIAKSKNNLDNGILQCDYIIKQIYTKLKEKGYLQNPVIVLTADHGDEIGEYGLFTHKINMNWTTLNIPLLFYGLDSSKFENKRLARLIDIAPTVVEAAGYPVPPNWEGRSLLSNQPDSFSYHQTYIKSKKNMAFSIVYYTKGDIYRYQFNFGFTKEALYKISVDPTEKVNIIDSETAVSKMLRDKARNDFDKIFWTPKI